MSHDFGYSVYNIEKQDLACEAVWGMLLAPQTHNPFIPIEQLRAIRLPYT